MKEILPQIETLLSDRAAIVNRLTEACGRVGGGGRELMRALRQALAPQGESAAAGDALARSVLQLGAGHTESGHSSAQPTATVKPIGSRLAQALLQLPSSAGEPLLQSLAAFPAGALVDLGLNSLGSRVLEVAFRTPGAKQPQGKILKAISSQVPRLARDTAGSYVVEAAFAASSVDEKSKLMEALAGIESDLQSSSHGTVTRPTYTRPTYIHLHPPHLHPPTSTPPTSTSMPRCPRRPCTTHLLPAPSHHHHHSAPPTSIPHHPPPSYHLQPSLEHPRGVNL